MRSSCFVNHVEKQKTDSSFGLLIVLEQQIIKHFLDIMHTRHIDHGTLANVLLLMKFLCDEGKPGETHLIMLILNFKVFRTI